MHAGALRVRLIAAGNPVIQDAVITGHDRDEVGALVFLSPAARDLATRRDARRASPRRLRALAAEGGGSSTHPARALVMHEPPSIDANEITDKGYINQRAVLERRAALVEALYAEGAEVVLPEPAPAARWPRRHTAVIAGIATSGPGSGHTPAKCRAIRHPNRPGIRAGRPRLCPGTALALGPPSCPIGLASARRRRRWPAWPRRWWSGSGAGVTAVTCPGRG